MPELHVTRPRALAAAAVSLVLLLVGGRLLLGAGAASAPPAAPIEAIAAAPRPPLVVHVVGAVRAPGLYRLKRGERIADAVAAAGGAAKRADLALINLAAPLADGQQIVVPARVVASPAAGGDAEGAVDGGGGPVHLNTATLEQLDALPGVGPVTAQKILDYRQEHGAFSSIRELDAIPGIGPARLEQLEGAVAP